MTSHQIISNLLISTVFRQSHFRKMKRKLSLGFYFVLLNLTCSLQRPVLLLGSSWFLVSVHTFLHLVGTFILKLFSLIVHSCSSRASLCLCVFLFETMLSWVMAVMVNAFLEAYTMPTFLATLWASPPTRQSTAWQNTRYISLPIKSSPNKIPEDNIEISAFRWYLRNPH